MMMAARERSAAAMKTLSPRRKIRIPSRIPPQGRSLSNKRPSSGAVQTPIMLTRLNSPILNLGGEISKSN